MTTQQEDQAIHNLLPEMVKEPMGYDLSEGQSFDPDELFPLANRLKEEKLALPTNSIFYVTITTEGKRIAERSDGYLGYLQEKEKRQRTEESRAKKNVAGTFGSFIVAGLALAFALYTYFATNQDTSALEKKVQLLEQRLKALEQHR